MAQNTTYSVYVIPLIDSYYSVIYALQSLNKNINIDYKAYLLFAVKSIFEEPGNNIAQSECRTILAPFFDNEESLIYVEHQMFVSIIERIKDAYDDIKEMSSLGLISGFYFDVNNNYDLVITIMFDKREQAF